MIWSKIKFALKFGIVIENSKIPALLSWFINIRAITIYPFIIFRGKTDEQTINHERIHIVQQRELLVLPFYLLYVWYWLINLLVYKETSRIAYYNIPFEQEAYTNDGNLGYLVKRKSFSWRNYFALR